MAQKFYQKKGANVPDFEATIKNANDTPIDLQTALSVEIKIKGQNSQIITRECEILDDGSEGKVRCPNITEGLQPGKYPMEIHVLFPDDKLMVLPTEPVIRGVFHYLIVQESLV